MIINGIDKANQSSFFETDSGGGRRGHSSKLFKKRSRLDIRICAYSKGKGKCKCIYIARFL